MEQITNNNYNDYDEISLKELIQVIFDYKKIIAIITLTCVFLGALYAFVIKAPEYESTVLLSISPATTQKSNLEGIENSIDYSYAKYNPDITVESYMQQIKTPQILKNVIVELNLKNDDGQLISYNELSDRIKVTTTKGTNLISVTVSGSDAEETTLIANTLSRLFSDYITEKSKEKNQHIAALIEEQLVVEAKNVEEKSNAIVKYLENGVNIDQLSQEVIALANNITDMKLNMSALEQEIMKNQLSLKVLYDKTNIRTSNLVNTEIVFNQNQDEDQNPYEEAEIRLVQNLNVSNSNAIQNTLLSIEITNLETELLRDTSQMEAERLLIESKEEELKEKKILLEKEKYNYGALNKELTLANQTYNAYQQRHKEAVVAMASDMGNASITVFSEALVPTSSSGKSKILFLMISLVLGLMIGVFVAFFKHYWETSK